MLDLNLARVITTELRCALADPTRSFATEYNTAGTAGKPTVTVTAPFQYTRPGCPEFGEIEAIVERYVGHPVATANVAPVEWRGRKGGRSRITFVVLAAAGAAQA